MGSYPNPATSYTNVPDIFSGTGGVDETYLVGQWKNKYNMVRDAGTKRKRYTNKQPFFGILCRNWTFWAEVVNDIEAGALQPLINRQVSPGSIVCTEKFLPEFFRESGRVGPFFDPETTLGILLLCR